MRGRDAVGASAAAHSRRGATDREALVERGRTKPAAPYTLDEALTFFCPQENLEGLDLPAVREAHADQLAWAAAPGDGMPSVLLLLPCQAAKPYPLSGEHRAVNGALLAAGWTPDGPGDWPPELAAHVDDPRLLSEAPLRRDGWRLDRATISEPFGLVPYEHTYRWRGELSPFSRYDDPGLFEHRRIDPTWRADCTARDGRWGDNERAAFVATHDRLVGLLHAVLLAARPRYDAIVAYVAPGLTHRSFLGDTAARRAAGLPSSRRAHGVRQRLDGVGDRAPGLVELVPGDAGLAALRGARGGRLPADILQHDDAIGQLTRRLDALTGERPWTSGRPKPMGARGVPA